MSSEVLRANIDVHTRMASEYTTSEPHFRPENKRTVRQRLEALRRQAPGGKLLDIGCGTGFIIELALHLFDEIHGLDITPAMMSQVDTSMGNVVLHESTVEEMPFADGNFDVVTAYSFIDHVEDTARVLREVSRVLRLGGLLYVGLVPNRFFWQALIEIDDDERASLSDIVAREHRMVRENDLKVERDYGIQAATFRAAEPGKEQGGIDPDDFLAQVLASGFSECTVSYDWFLGQGAVMHRQSFAEAETISRYLQRAKPLTRHLFKYLIFEARK